MGQHDLEKAQGIFEYALIIALIALVVIGVVSLVGPRIGNIFSSIVPNL